MYCHAGNRFKRFSGLLVQRKYCFPCLVTFLKNLKDTFGRKEKINTACNG